MLLARCLKAVVTLVVLLGAASAQADENVSVTRGVAGSSAWGGRGLNYLDAARPLSPGALVVSGSGSFFFDRNMFASGDSDQFIHGELLVAWAPGAGFELGVGESISNNSYVSYFSRTIQVLGNPTLHVKWRQDVTSGLDLGAVVHVMVPTAAGQGGLVPRAAIIDVRALLTASLASFLDLTINIGGILDNTHLLLSDPIPAEKRLALGISENNRLIYGVGLLSRFNATPVAIGPFVEVRGFVSQNIPIAQNEVRASVGTKLYPTDSHYLEGTLAVNLLVAQGGAYARSQSPAAPPWQAVASLGLHLFEEPDAPTQQTCNEDRDCPQDQACRNNYCVIVQIQKVEVLKEVVKAQETFKVEGSVVDATTKRPIGGAIIIIAGYEQTPLITKDKLGTFVSWPLPVGPGLLQLQVNAAGYKSEEHVIRRDTHKNETVTIALTPDNRPALGKLKGSIRDDKTGKPLADCFIFVPALQVKISSDKNGTFEKTVHIGRYDVIISRKGYASQKKKVNIQDGDVVILDVDMHKGSDE